jgi:hypothetical protein
MRGKAFLATAQHLLTRPGEADWRMAAVAAYYALMLEGRDALSRWGFAAPAHAAVHAFVRLRFFVPSHADLRAVGRTLDELVRLRNAANYQIAHPGAFATNRAATTALAEAGTAVTLLEQLGADAARQAAARAAIHAAFP